MNLFFGFYFIYFILFLFSFTLVLNVFFSFCLILLICVLSFFSLLCNLNSYKTFHTFQVPPEINEGPTEIAASVNTQTTLMCETNGQPAPTVEWEKNGEPFPSTGLRHRMMSSGSLEFMLVRLEDDGEYTCTASNAAGNVTRTITLQVQGQRNYIVYFISLCWVVFH